VKETEGEEEEEAGQLPYETMGSHGKLAASSYHSHNRVCNISHAYKSLATESGFYKTEVP
jgi:hypothetical protein